MARKFPAKAAQRAGLSYKGVALRYRSIAVPLCRGKAFKDRNDGLGAPYSRLTLAPRLDSGSAVRCHAARALAGGGDRRRAAAEASKRLDAIRRVARGTWLVSGERGIEPGQPLDGDNCPVGLNHPVHTIPQIASAVPIRFVANVAYTRKDVLSSFFLTKFLCLCPTRASDICDKLTILMAQPALKPQYLQA